MSVPHLSNLTDLIGAIPYRLALAGGWIDQPFLSLLNPTPPGSMVVVGVEPSFRYMDRAGMATSTRRVAQRLWNGRLPDENPAVLMRTLYAVENAGKAEPSGAQDMAGLIYPGINRLDFDAAVEGGFFPCHIESNNDPQVIHWLENVLWIVPVNQRPDGYNPLGVKHLDAAWVQRLGQSGKDCFSAIQAQNAAALGESMNETMRCWEALLPATVRHPTLSIDLMALLSCYQQRYAGAMYSGCGGGYLFVISEAPVPGGFHAKLRIANKPERL